VNRKQRRHKQYQYVRTLRRHTRFKHRSRSKTVRIETGMMRFWGDWPGLFIRGDDAIGHMNSIRAVLDFAEKSLTRA